MPLKLTPPRKGKSPNWTIRGTYLGHYVNQTAGSPRRAVAIKELTRVQDEIERGRFSKPGEVTFVDAVDAYLNTASGARPPARERESRRILRKLSAYFGERPISEIGQAEIDAAAMALYPHASPATRNRQCYSPLSAVLKRAGAKFDIQRPAGSAGKKQTAWLWPEQTEALFGEAEKLDRDFAALLIVLCYTGLRLSEALNLTWNDVRLQDGYAYVPDTKNGEPLGVFLPPVAVAALANIDRSAAKVFRISKGGHAYSLLRTAAFRAGIELPERSAFHILRHTYMTWMRRYGGLDEIGLLNLGRHKDRKSVGRYTHAVISEEARRAALLPTPATKRG